MKNKQEAMLSGDSQFQEFFVKLQHLVLSLLANNPKDGVSGQDARSPFFSSCLCIENN